MSKLGNTFTTVQLREAAEKRFPHMTIDGVVFRNPLWLTPEEREQFLALLKDEDRGVAESTRDVLMLAAEDKKAAKTVLDGLAPEVAVWNILFNAYMETSEAGEA